MADARLHVGLLVFVTLVWCSPNRRVTYYRELLKKTLVFKKKMKKWRYEEQRHNEDNRLTLAVAQLYDFMLTFSRPQDRQKVFFFFSVMLMDLLNIWVLCFIEGAMTIWAFLLHDKSVFFLSRGFIRDPSSEFRQNAQKTARLSHSCTDVLRVFMTKKEIQRDIGKWGLTLVFVALCFLTVDR